MMSWITNPGAPIPPDQPGFPSVGTLGAGLLPVLGGIYDTYQRSRDVKREIAARKAEAELAYQRSVEMWHMQNAYNSPLEQMKRFGAAGLNPHLMYGQGSGGNAQGTPQYQPPNIQMQGASPPYGGAIAGILPTLMSVGTWLQNMRMSEVDINRRQTDVEKMEQMIAYLAERNPRQIQSLDNALSMYPYQKSMQRTLADRAQVVTSGLLEEFRYKWGVPLETEFDQYTYAPRGGGAKGVEFLKNLAEQKLKSAQASWTDYNITNPQGLIQLVLAGVMGMAGMSMRASMGKINQNRRPKITETETIKRVGRTRSTRREYYPKK